MALFLFGTFYATMVAAGCVIELVFAPLGLVPTGPRHASVGDAAISWNYTAYLNIVFLVLAALLVARFYRTGGRPWGASGLPPIIASMSPPRAPPPPRPEPQRNPGGRVSSAPRGRMAEPGLVAGPRDRSTIQPGDVDRRRSIVRG